MRKAFYLLFALIGLFNSYLYATPQYKLVVGTMFKNEAPWLKEWLEYHRLIGVEHFYLYNNDSSDTYQEVLDPYIKEGVVELISWDSDQAPWHAVEPPRFVGFQLTAFNDCIKRALGRAEWVAIIDIDEYIVPLAGIHSFRSLLDTALKSDIGSFIIRWKCFGTSYIWEIPENRLMTETLVMRTDDHFHANSLGKCIHRPEAVTFCSVHYAALKPGYREESIWDMRINHYQMRGQKELLLKRCGLGDLTECSSPQALQCLKDQEALFNKIEDREIRPYLPGLRKAMGFP